MELVKSSLTHFTVTPLEFVRNQKIEINGDKINGGVEDVKDVNEKKKDLSVSILRQLCDTCCDKCRQTSSFYPKKNR